MKTSALVNEKEILALVAGGDEAAFAGLFHHYRKKIYSVGLALTKSEHMAEELVQDVFLKIWLKRQDLTGIQHFEAHLFIITRNHAFNMLRRVANSRKLEQHLVLHAGPAATVTDDFIQEKANQKLLADAIERLSPQQKQVYRLIKQEGLKRDEAAERLGLSTNTVKEHLSKAVKNVRAYCAAHLRDYLTALSVIIPLMKD